MLLRMDNIQKEKKGNSELFVRIEDVDDIVLPKVMYNDDTRICYPVDGDHMKKMRTTWQKGSVPKLLEAATVPPKQDEDGSTFWSLENQKPAIRFGWLCKRKVKKAGGLGNPRLSLMSERKLKIQVCHRGVNQNWSGADVFVMFCCIIHGGVIFYHRSYRRCLDYYCAFFFWILIQWWANNAFFLTKLHWTLEMKDNNVINLLETQFPKFV